MQLLNIFGCILLAGCLSINTVKALRCHKCDSRVEKGCENQKYVDAAEKCLLSDTDCFTLKFETNIIRGCVSDIPDECTTKQKECGIEYCNTNACNKEIYPKPVSELKCYKCSGVSCASIIHSPGIKAKLCENYSEKDSCYSYLDNKKNVVRGCTSDLDSPCPGSKGCDICENPGCNNKIYEEDKHRLKCYQCSGASCASTSEIWAKLCENYSEEDQCYSYLDSKTNVLRGCTSDLDSPCPGIGCDMCKRNGCNFKTYKEDTPKLKCYQCSGAGCASTSEITARLCKHDSEKEQCYSHLDSKKNVLRGCTSDEDSPCPGSKGCDICENPGCNIKIYEEDKPTLKCYQCSGPSCAFASEITASLCKNYSEEDSCYSYLDIKKNVVRGCTSDLDSPCPGSKGCDICKKPGCNIKIYEEDKPTLKCFQCSGASCASTSQISARLCQNYSDKDQCYSYLDNEKNVFRGCLSDKSSMCPRPGIGCEVCVTSGCNNKIYKENTPTLKCYQCSGKDCLTDLRKPPTLCKDYAEADKCYTYVDDEKNVFRGCVSDIKSHCQDSFCVSCEGEGCNKKPEIIQHSCNVCQGNSKSCVGESGKNGVCSVSAPGKCTVLLGRQQICFTYHEINKFERGCGQNLKQSYDNKFLETCVGENCNSNCLTFYEDEEIKTVNETAQFEISLSKEELLIESGPVEGKNKIPPSQELLSHLPTGEGLLFKMMKTRLNITLRGNRSLKF